MKWPKRCWNGVWRIKLSVSLKGLNTMDQSLVLQEEILLLKNLHGLADQKRQALLDNNWEALRKVTEDEEVAVKRLTTMEETRLEQAGSFSDDEKNEMRRLVQELKVKNEFNQLVLNDALVYTRFFLNAIMGATAPAATYGAEGTLQGTAYRQLIDDRG